MIIFTDAEKAFDIYDKSSPESGNRGNLCQYEKAIYNKSIAN